MRHYDYSKENQNNTQNILDKLEELENKINNIERAIKENKIYRSIAMNSYLRSLHAEKSAYEKELSDTIDNTIKVMRNDGRL